MKLGREHLSPRGQSPESRQHEEHRIALLARPEVLTEATGGGEGGARDDPRLAPPYLLSCWQRLW